MEAIRTSSIVLFESDSHTPRPITGCTIIDRVGHGFLQDSKKITALFQTYTAPITLPPLPSPDRISPAVAFVLPVRELQCEPIRRGIAAWQEVAKTEEMKAFHALIEIYRAAMARIGLGGSFTAMARQDGSPERTEESGRSFTISQANASIEEIAGNFARAVPAFAERIKTIQEGLHHWQGQWDELCKLGV